MSNTNMNILDLVSQNRLQSFQDAFSKRNKVAIIMIDLHGKPLTRPSGFCRLCQLIRSTGRGEQECQNNDRSVAQQVSSTQKYAIKTCPRTGFADAAAPIIVRGEHIASWGIGQANIQGGVSEDDIRLYAKKIGVEPESLVEAFHEKSQDSMPMTHFQKIIEDLLEYCKPIINSAEINLITQIDSQKQ